MKLISVVILIFSFYSLFAQKTDSLKIPAKPEMYLQVKQLNQFFERFNYEKDFNDRKIDTAFARKISRQDYIRLLFNTEDKRLNENNLEAKEYQTLQSRFVDFVCKKENPQTLHRESNYIFAEALCEVLYHGKVQNVTLFLKSKKLANQGMKWEIIAVHQNLILWDSTENNSYYIPPNSHETNFLSLNQLFKNKKCLPQLTPEKFRFDNLSAFLTLIYEGIVTFKFVSEVRYSLLEIPGWIIKIKDFQRNTLNSGWLIYDIQQVDEIEKLKIENEWK